MRPLSPDSARIADYLIANQPAQEVADTVNYRRTPEGQAALAELGAIVPPLWRRITMPVNPAPYTADDVRLYRDSRPSGSSVPLASGGQSAQPSLYAASSSLFGGNAPRPPSRGAFSSGVFGSARQSGFPAASSMFDPSSLSNAPPSLLQGGFGLGGSGSARPPGFSAPSSTIDQLFLADRPRRQRASVLEGFPSLSLSGSSNSPPLSSSRGDPLRRSSEDSVSAFGGDPFAQGSEGLADPAAGALTPDLLQIIAGNLPPRNALALTSISRATRSQLQSEHAAALIIRDIRFVSTSKQVLSIIDRIKQLPDSFQMKPFESLSAQILRLRPDVGAQLRKLLVPAIPPGRAANSGLLDTIQQLDRNLERASNAGVRRAQPALMLSAQFRIKYKGATAEGIAKEFGITHPQDVAQLTAIERHVQERGGPRAEPVHMEDARARIVNGLTAEEAAAQLNITDQQDLEDLRRFHASLFLPQ